MSPQQTIAHYRITAKLGEGGMGAVYRATDTKLNREVAIKVLPDSFAADADRMARFAREAQLLASLNHPNIAAIYGVEERALVLELVEGEDLHGPLPVETALSYAHQIALALEAAHEKGIIHRDLKPANIKVTPEGVVKLLDFGLAKATEASSNSNASFSPTMTIGASLPGSILGTAGYMAPEQARGKAVDKRADIWAFGVVLYEMLTGAELFAKGETVTDILAAVVTREPDWTALPEGTPAHVRRLLERCLRKDPKMRLRDIGEARITLEEAPPTTPQPAPPRHTALPWAIVALAVLLSAGVLAWQSFRAPAPQGIAGARFTIPFPEGTEEIPTSGGRTFVPSPDGTRIAFAAVDKTDNQQRLWIRPLNATAAQKIEKSDGANFPFWSPDSQSVGFFTGTGLRRLDLATGSVQTICEFPGSSISRSNNGAAWGPGGVILFSRDVRTALSRVQAAGGAVEPATELDAAAGEHRHGWPQFLPDGKHFLYLAQTDEEAKDAIYVGELGTSRRNMLIRSSTPAAFVLPRFLFFVRERTLMAQHFDPESLQISGDAVPLATDVSSSGTNGRAAFAVSGNGVLVYRHSRETGNASLQWVDRDGKEQGTVGKPAAYTSLKLSPDGRSAAVFVEEERAGNAGFLGIVDLATGAIRNLSNLQTTRIFWSADSQRLYCSRLSRGIASVAVDSGAVTEVIADKTLRGLEALTPDGAAMVVRSGDDRQISLLPLATGAAVQPLPHAPSARSLRISPDGKRVAWSTSESNSLQVMVAEFPSFAGQRQISIDGGTRPEWSPDGREVLYTEYKGSGDASRTALMAVEVPPGLPLRPGLPKKLFQFNSATNIAYSYAPAADGKRFLILKSMGTPETPQIVVVLNWRAEFHL